MKLTIEVEGTHCKDLRVALDELLERVSAEIGGPGASSECYESGMNHDENSHMNAFDGKGKFNIVRGCPVCDPD